MTKNVNVIRGRRNTPELANPARQALRQLGKNILEARLHRRIPAAILAERASVSRTTLHKIERGEAGVAIGNYAAVLFSLGLIDALAGIADPKNDQIGRMLERERLPKRVRLPQSSQDKHRSKKGG